MLITGSKLAGMYSTAAVITNAAVVLRLCGRRTNSCASQRGHSDCFSPIARTVARQRVHTRSPRLRPVASATARGAAASEVVTTDPRCRCALTQSQYCSLGVALVSAAIEIMSSP